MEKGGSAAPLPPCLNRLVNGGSKESHKYYQARRTVLEMLRDRGYLVPNSEIELSLLEFREKYGESPESISKGLHQILHQIIRLVLVVFCGPSTIKVSTVRAIASSIMNDESLSRLILIIQDQMTNQAMKSVELKQLPRMCQTDAIAQYYGLEKGQVLKVTYNSEITETHVTYRCIW